jgi:hypothetical protein
LSNDHQLVDVDTHLFVGAEKRGSEASRCEPQADLAVGVVAGGGLPEGVLGKAT